MVVPRHNLSKAGPGFRSVGSWNAAEGSCPAGAPSAGPGRAPGPGWAWVEGLVWGRQQTEVAAQPDCRTPGQCACSRWLCLCLHASICQEPSTKRLSAMQAIQGLRLWVVGSDSCAMETAHRWAGVRWISCVMHAFWQECKAVGGDVPAWLK